MFVQHARLTSYKICSFNQKYRNKSKIIINKRDYLFYYLYVENTHYATKTNITWLSHMLKIYNTQIVSLSHFC